MSLTIDPPTLQISAGGGVATHNLINDGDKRLAFKIKSTNNAHYRLKPVYGFVPPNSSTPIQVTRLIGPPKEDKLVVQYVEVPEEVTDAAAFMKENKPSGEAELPICAIE